MRPYDDPYAAEQLMAAFLHAPSGVAVVSVDGRLLHVNPALARILGRPERELTTLRWQDLVDPRDLATVEAAVAGAIATNGELDEVARIQRPDGRERELRVMARVVDTGPGHPAGLVAHIEDMTTRIVQVRRVQTLAGQLRALVEAAPDAIVIRGGDGLIALWNPSAETMFGVPAAAAIGRPFEDLVLVQDEHARYVRLHARMSTGETLRERMRARRADGTTFPVQVSAALLLESGRSIGTVAIIRDITDLVAAERELAERAAQLQRSNTDLEAVAVAASHDLQEPLRSIAMAVDAVQRSASDRLDDDEGRLLAYIGDAVESMSDRVAALMALARLRPSEAPQEPIAADPAIDDALAGLRAAIRESGAEIDVRRPLPSLPIPREELALVLQNLVGNAIKFRRPGVHPRVTISGAERGDYAEIEVADDGVGLTEADRARIFAPFARAAEEVEGTGLGLSVASRIVERRHGSVSAASEGPGRGARFTLRLPRQPE